jgi:MFS family permease
MPVKIPSMRSIPKTVFILGLVSLFTDASSEMIFPLLPLFLTQVLGAGPMAIGIIEGVAESTSSVLKVFSGVWTDRLKRRKPLIVMGYSLSGFFRPFIGLAQTWPSVLVLRFVDRIGKGLRSSPRDALIADVTSPSNRGASFGFHNAMDHAGAVVGPLLACLLISPLIHLTYRTVFLLSAVPALAAWLTLVLGVKEKSVPGRGKSKSLNLTGDWKELGGSYKNLLLAILVFTLGNSTDAYLLVRMVQEGIPAWWIPFLWSAFHLVKMTSSYYGGRLSDHAGRRPMILTGWIYYAAIYTAFAMVENSAVLVGVFLAYGFYYGLTEASEKAMVADLAPKTLRGTAFGYYNLVVGLGALPASLIFGFIGQRWGYPAAFLTGAALAGIASAMLFFAPDFKNRKT